MGNGKRNYLGILEAFSVGNMSGLWGEWEVEGSGESGEVEGSGGSGERGGRGEVGGEREGVEAGHVGAAGGGEDVDVGGHAAVAFVTGPGHGYLWGNAKGEKGGDEGLAPGVGGDVLPFREVGDVSDRADEADGLHGGVDAGFAGDLFESFVVVGIVAQLRKDQVVGGVGGEGARMAREWSLRSISRRSRVLCVTTRMKSG